MADVVESPADVADPPAEPPADVFPPPDGAAEEEDNLNNDVLGPGRDDHDEDRQDEEDHQNHEDQDDDEHELVIERKLCLFQGSALQDLLLRFWRVVLQHQRSVERQPPRAVLSVSPTTGGGPVRHPPENRSSDREHENVGQQQDPARPVSPSALLPARAAGVLLDQDLSGVTSVSVCISPGGPPPTAEIYSRSTRGRQERETHHVAPRRDRYSMFHDDART